MSAVRKALMLAAALAAAGTTIVATPGTASAAVCVAPGGGRKICEYETLSHTFADNTRQQFVVGTDFHVWTRWQSHGTWTTWRDHGGRVSTNLDPANFRLSGCARQPTVHVRGTDNRWWYNGRWSNGEWTGWVRNDDGVECVVG